MEPGTFTELGLESFTALIFFSSLSWFVLSKYGEPEGRMPCFVLGCVSNVVGIISLFWQPMIHIALGVYAVLWVIAFICDLWPQNDNGRTTA